MLPFKTFILHHYTTLWADISQKPQWMIIKIYHDMSIDINSICSSFGGYQDIHHGGFLHLVMIWSFWSQVWNRYGPLLDQRVS